jgi:hypothetical protein
MYADPALIRDKTVKLSLNDLENNLIQAWVDYHGAQKATFIRDLVLEQARLDLGLDVAASEGQQMALLSSAVGTSK